MSLLSSLYMTMPDNDLSRVLTVTGYSATPAHMALWRLGIFKEQFRRCGPSWFIPIHRWSRMNGRKKDKKLIRFLWKCYCPETIHWCRLALHLLCVIQPSPLDPWDHVLHSRSPAVALSLYRKACQRRGTPSKEKDTQAYPVAISVHAPQYTNDRNPPRYNDVELSSRSPSNQKF